MKEGSKKVGITFKCRTLNNTLLRHAMTIIEIITAVSAKTATMGPYRSNIGMSRRPDTSMTAPSVAIELSKLITSCLHATLLHPPIAPGSTTGAQAAEAPP